MLSMFFKHFIMKYLKPIENIGWNILNSYPCFHPDLQKARSERHTHTKKKQDLEKKGGYYNWMFMPVSK